MTDKNELARWHAQSELRMAKMHIHSITDGSEPETARECAWRCLCQALYWSRRARAAQPRWLAEHGVST